MPEPLDRYQQDIEWLIRQPWSVVKLQWEHPDRRPTPLFSFCGKEADCGCPTTIAGGLYRAATPELTETIRNIPGIPGIFGQLFPLWDTGTLDDRRAGLEPFRLAQIATDEAGVR